MANLNAPNGFSPVASLLGTKWNEQGRLYCIPSSDSTNTYAVGDVVMSAASADSNGVPYVQKWGAATTTSALPLGIIVGIRVADPGVSLQGVDLTLSLNYVPKTKARAYYVYVVDDPFVLFEAQFDSTAVAAANLHQNAAVTVTAEQTTLSMSAPYSSTVLTSPATTATLPVRLLGLVQRAGNSTGAYARVLCKWNYHEFGVTAGASGSVVGYLAP